MAANLQDLLRKSKPKEAPPAVPAEPAEAKPIAPTVLNAPEGMFAAAPEITEIEVVALIGKAAMTFTFSGNTNPITIPDFLRTIDPDVKFRETLAMGKTYGGGPTLSARVIGLNWQSGPYRNIKFACEGDISVTLNFKKPDDKNERAVSVEDFLKNLLELEASDLAERLAIVLEKTERADGFMMIPGDRGLNVQYSEGNGTNWYRGIGKADEKGGVHA